MKRIGGWLLDWGPEVLVILLIAFLIGTCLGLGCQERLDAESPPRATVRQALVKGALFRCECRCFNVPERQR